MNGLLVACFVSINLMQFFLLPLWLLPTDPRWGWLLLPVALSSLTFWALIHEAIHGSLSGSRRLNHLAGRLLAVAYGAPFQVLRRGHLLHHGLSRTPRDRSEVYDDARVSRAQAAPAYYFRLLGGLYVYEWLCVPLFLLPRRWIRAAGRRLAREDNVVALMAEKLTQAAVLREVRLDACAILLLFGFGFWVYGSQAWLLALALYGRALIVSLNDNAYHYATPLGETRYAMSLSLPGWLARLLLNFNYHGTHHRQPHLGWRDLPHAFAAERGSFQLGMGTALWRQLRGPIPLSALAGPMPQPRLSSG